MKRFDSKDRDAAGYTQRPACARGAGPQVRRGEQSLATSAGLIRTSAPSARHVPVLRATRLSASVCERPCVTEASRLIPM